MPSFREPALSPELLTRVPLRWVFCRQARRQGSTIQPELLSPYPGAAPAADMRTRSRARTIRTAGTGTAVRSIVPAATGKQDDLTPNLNRAAIHLLQARGANGKDSLTFYDL